MIEILETTDESVCVRCGQKIVRHSGDLTGDRGWTHWVGSHGEVPCLGANVAAPYKNEEEPWSPGLGFRWDALGVEEGGLPLHLPMGLTAEEEGPATGEDLHHWGCWCGDRRCGLDLSLREASGCPSA